MPRVTLGPLRPGLEELELLIRHLAVLADNAPVDHRRYLACEVIALSDELWRLQFRCERHGETATVRRGVVALERDIARLRATLDRLDADGSSFGDSERVAA